MPQYFNDRLYHSKMHFERIHVKQGKSMPRKRKYMEPAGSTAGEAGALPPPTHKQPDVRHSRVRRPGDKWLKTASDHGSHTGFRYESVHDRAKSGRSRSTSPTLDADVVSDDGLFSPSDIEQKSSALSPRSQALYCWEASRAIVRGAEAGSLDKSWKQVYTFQSPRSIFSAAITEPVSPPEAGAMLAASKKWRWWWYNPPNEEGSDDEIDSDEDGDSTYGGGGGGGGGDPHLHAAQGKGGGAPRARRELSDDSGRLPLGCGPRGSTTSDASGYQPSAASVLAPGAYTARKQVRPRFSRPKP